MAKHLIVELEAVLLEKGKSSKDLVRATGHTTVNVSRIRQAKMRGIRMDTLMEICLELDCQPGDILKYLARYMYVRYRQSLEPDPENQSHSSSPS